MIKRIIDPELLKDFIEWSDDMDKRLLGNKAIRIYYKCLLYGRTELAKRIEYKYGRLFPKYDLIMAMSMVLYCQKK